MVAPGRYYQRRRPVTLDVQVMADLLRMRYCPARWDFGMRYMDRDLPAVVYRRFCELLFVQHLKDLEMKLATAGAWGAALLKELGPTVGADRETAV